ncbi:MAG TPA: right-handed parallel beta-helix repeat-containing protein, partial [Luteolibacter sp.]|nr:right-handed parallel beta-helix repeat-containing protein [Luteolibacter sp.]
MKTPVHTLLAACSVLSIASMSAAEFHVPGDFPTIQAALDAATNGDKVIVAPGTYQESLSFGGEDIELASAAGAQFTTLDVANTTGIVMGPNGSLVGFTVLNGKLPSGGAVKVSGRNSYIADNVFEGNNSEGRPETGSISMIDASPVIERNVFRNNVAIGSPITPFGGLIELLRASSPLIANNVFHDNQSAAITLYQPFPETSPVIVNNTIVRTRTGISMLPFGPIGNLVIRNNIIVDGEIGVAGRGDLGFYWQHNLVFGNTASNYYRTTDLTGVGGNLSADPLFLDSANDDFQLAITSPAIDAGTNMAAPLYDFAGNPRPADGDGDGNALTDIGAFEMGGGVGIGIEVDGGLEQECNTTGGAILNVRITTSPEDVELSSVSITVNGNEVADRSPANVFFPLGVSELKATAVTTDGTILERVEFVGISDTTPPVIRAWFEDRKSGQVIESIDSRKMHLMVIRIVADDVCDSDPQVTSVLGAEVKDGEPLRIQGNKGQVAFAPDELTLNVSAT